MKVGTPSAHTPLGNTSHLHLWRKSYMAYSPSTYSPGKYSYLCFCKSTHSIRTPSRSTPRLHLVRVFGNSIPLAITPSEYREKLKAIREYSLGEPKAGRGQKLEFEGVLITLPFQCLSFSLKSDHRRNQRKCILNLDCGRIFAQDQALLEGQKGSLLCRILNDCAF